MDYWVNRNIKSQEKLSSKSIKDAEKQLKKYYRKTAQSVIADFVSTYEKLLSTVEAGNEISVSDLYKLDKYWKMQTELTSKLQKLGDKQSVFLSKQFVETYKDIYEAMALPAEESFSMVNDEVARQMVDRVWCADGKSWSKRIWDNTEKLQKSLNDNLISCVVAGKNPEVLKKILKRDFGVSYRRADALVRTEITHIQAEAARQRYMNGGIEEMEIYATKDERVCPVCGKLHETKIPIGSTMIPPFHTNCRCCLIPVVKDF